MTAAVQNQTDLLSHPKMENEKQTLILSPSVKNVTDTKISKTRQKDPRNSLCRQRISLSSKHYRQGQHQFKVKVNLLKKMFIIIARLKKRINTQKSFYISVLEKCNNNGKVQIEPSLGNHKLSFWDAIKWKNNLNSKWKWRRAEKIQYFLIIGNSTTLSPGMTALLPRVGHTCYLLSFLWCPLLKWAKWIMIRILPWNPVHFMKVPGIFYSSDPLTFPIFINLLPPYLQSLGMSSALATRLKPGQVRSINIH